MNNKLVSCYHTRIIQSVWNTEMSTESVIEYDVLIRNGRAPPRPSAMMYLHDGTCDLCGSRVLTTGKRSVRGFTDRKGAGRSRVCLTSKRVGDFFFSAVPTKRIRIGYGIFTTDRTFSDRSPPAVGAYVYGVLCTTAPLMGRTTRARVY